MQTPTAQSDHEQANSGEESARVRRYKLITRLTFPDKTVAQIAKTLNGSPETARAIDQALRDLDVARQAARRAIRRLVKLAKTWATFH